MDEIISKMEMCCQRINSIEQSWISEEEALFAKLNAIVLGAKTPKQEKKKAKLLNTIYQEETEESTNGLQANSSTSQRPKRNAKKKVSSTLKEPRTSDKQRQPEVIKLEKKSRARNESIQMEDRTRSKRITRQNLKESLAESNLMIGSGENLSLKVYSNSSVEIISNENSLIVISEEESDVELPAKKVEAPKKLVENVSGRVTRSRIKEEKDVVDIAPKRELRSSRQTNTTQHNNIEDKTVDKTVYESATSENFSESSIVQVVQEEEIYKECAETVKLVELDRPKIVQNETFIAPAIQDKPSDATFAIVPTNSTFLITNPEKGLEKANNMVVISDATFCAKEGEQQIDSEICPLPVASNTDLSQIHSEKIQCSEPKAIKKTDTPILQGNNISSKLTKQSSKENRNLPKPPQKKAGTPTTRAPLLGYCTPELQPKNGQAISAPLKKFGSNSKQSPSPSTKITLKSYPNKKVPLLRSNSLKDAKLNSAKIQLKEDNTKKKQTKHLENKKPPGREVLKPIKALNMEIKQQEEYIRRLEQKRLEAEIKENQRKERQIREETIIKKTYQENQNNLAQNSETAHIQQEIQNPYNFHMLHSGDSTDDERRPKKTRPPIPMWSRSAIRRMQIDRQSHLPTSVIDCFFSTQAMNPDLSAIFPAINPEYLKRNSSVVWNTPPRYSQLPKY